MTAFDSDALASARAIDAINRKRAGEVLDPDVVERLVGDFVAGRVPDYQMAAWLATVACRGMETSEIAALTKAYIADGKGLDLSAVGRVVVDKHSTGGVGDTTTLVVVPVVAACGVVVAKMTGRALGWAGGTLDKLESIPGLRLHLGADEVIGMLRDVGMVITGQSPDLAPGDGATYALRDVTGTVESIPLIAASIVSKKVAVAADGLVLDIKTGSGALIPDYDMSVLLTETMIDLARSFGLSCRAVLSDMSQPLGRAVGNALEIKQALAVLRGERVPGLSDLCEGICRLMLQSIEPDLPDATADERVQRVLHDGSAYEMFLRWAGAQGADVRVLETPELLPEAPHRHVVTADRSGYVTGVDPRSVGQATLLIGAGRLLHKAPLDYGAGVVVHHRVGDEVAAGAPLAEIHYTSGDDAGATALVAGAFRIGDERPAPVPAIHRIF